MTVIQELISEFEEIKKTKCKTLQEVIFFDGVLAIIEGKYLKKEQDKNKYSEEEVIDSIKYTIDNFFNGKLAGLNSKEIFEQFKNK